MSRNRTPKTMRTKTVRPVAAALYNYLSDGQTHSMEDTIRAVMAAVPETSVYNVPSKKGGPEKARERGARAAARNAIYIAACDGRIIVDRTAKTVVATEDTIATWTAFRASTAVMPETAISVEPEAGTAPVVVMDDTPALVASPDEDTTAGLTPEDDFALPVNDFDDESETAPAYNRYSYTF